MTERKKYNGTYTDNSGTTAVIVENDFETSVRGLRAIGDGAGVTRGLQQASANGLSVARSILARMEENGVNTSMEQK